MGLVSNALPMSADRRYAVYTSGSGPMTERQYRHYRRMLLLEGYRRLGDLRHGASGARLRRPVVRTAVPPPRSAYVAVYCTPQTCPRVKRIRKAGRLVRVPAPHAQPRVHTIPREALEGTT